MKKIALLIVILFSCTNEDAARSVLADEGYTNVQTTGYAYSRCSDSDSTCTGFTATSPSGRPVSGAVGCGRDIAGCGKGCTVRLM